MIALVTLGGRVRAAEHPRVRIEIDECVPAPHEAVRRILAIELGALLDSDRGDDPAHTRVRLGCVDGLIEIAVDDPITRKSLRRAIDLRDAPADGHARLLGLAVAELITASWSELVVSPRPKVTPVGPAPSAASRASALATVQPEERPFVLRTRITAMGGGLALFAGTGMTGGGGVRVGRAHRYHVGWWVDAQAGHGSTGASLGQINTDLLHLGAAFVGHHAWSRIGLQGGVGLRVGAARLGGDPRTGSGATGGAVWGPWAGPMATVGLVAAPTRRLAIELGFEAGYVAAPVAGLVDGRREVAVQGGWVAFQIGIGAFL